jgi:hypothetical protein
MNETTTRLEETLAAALKLSPKERLQLAERLVSSVEGEMTDAEPPAALGGQTLKTGAEIVAMLNAMEPIEFVDPEITDPVEWVQAQRQKEVDRLKPYWDGEK